MSSGYICTLKKDKSGCRRIQEYDLEEEKELEQEKKQSEIVIATAIIIMLKE